MGNEEFDRFAKQYSSLHAENIRASGEGPEFFAEYKVKDTLRESRKCRLPEKISVLDFGSGIGESIPFFNKYFPRASITGIDVSKGSLSIAESRFGKDAEFRLFDGRIIPLPDDSNEIVFAACVFHHIPAEQHPDLLKEIYRVLKPGGILMLFEHNPYNPLTVRAVNTCPFDENARLIKGRVIKKSIREAGFTSVNLIYRIFFPGWLRCFRPMECFMKWFPIGAQYYVCARKMH